jgi:anti-sigma factor RsiW
MMPIDWTQEMLLSLSGELDPARQQALDAALAREAALRQTWTEMQQTQALLGSQQFRVQPYLATRVMARLAQPGAELKRAFSRLALPLLAAVIALVLLTYVQEDRVDLDTLSGLSQLDVESVALAEWQAW